MQFPLRDSRLGAAGMSYWVPVGAVAVALVSLGLLLSSELLFVGGLMWTALGTFFPPFLSMRGNGVVELQPEALVVRRGGTLVVDWTGVDDIRLVPAGEGGVTDRLSRWLMAANDSEPTVEITLRRSLRSTLGWPPRAGADVIGFPTFVKVIRLVPEDAEALVEEGRRHVAAVR